MSEGQTQNPRFETTDIKKPKWRKRWTGMNLKSLLTVFVILAIGALLLTTKSGQKFAWEALGSAKVKVGNFISALLSGKFKWGMPFGEEQTPTGEQFLISLTATKSSFYGQAYDVYNTSLEMAGVCDIGIKVGDITLKTKSLQCTIAAEDMRGMFEYTIAGTVYFEGDVSGLEIDGNRYTTSEGTIKTSFEVLPAEFTLVGLKEKKITLDSAVGSINRISSEGSIKSTESLDGELLEIYDFVGFIKIEDSNIKLQGLTVSVHGTGPHSSFSW